jgi:peptidoglycan hydrolase CwlO-like protein
MENGKAGVPAIFVKILMDKLNEPNLSAYIVDEEEIKKRANDAQKFSFRAILQTQTHRQNKDVSFDATLYRLFEMLERRDARIEEKNAEIKELRKQVAELKRSLRSSQ